MRRPSRTVEVSMRTCLLSRLPIYPIYAASVDGPSLTQETEAPFGSPSSGAGECAMDLPFGTLITVSALRSPGGRPAWARMLAKERSAPRAASSPDKVMGAQSPGTLWEVLAGQRGRSSRRSRVPVCFRASASPESEPAARLP
jgi:hypothetical protein